MGAAENELKRKVLELCGRLKVPTTKHQCGKIRLPGRTIDMGDDGWPDIIGVLPDGRFLGVETKTPRGKVEPSQIDRLSELNRNHAVLILSDDFEEIARELNAIVIQIRIRITAAELFAAKGAT